MAEQRRIIAVGGGKGGVGKSIVAVNLAVEIARQGRSVALVDADLGSANQHTMLGIDRPGPSLYSVIRGELKTLRDAMMRTVVSNLYLVPGAGAIPGSANLSEQEKNRLVQEVQTLPVDVVILDVGAGISYEVLDLYAAADQRIVVVLPQLTSFQNAYSFLKGAVHRTIRGCADTPARQKIFSELDPTRETERITSVLRQLEDKDPIYASRVKARLSHFGAKLIGNQVVSAKDRGTLGAVAKMFRDFLLVDPEILGALRFNRKMGDSINRRRPLALLEPNDDCVRAIHRVATTLLNEDVDKLRAGRVAKDGQTSPTEDEDDALLSQIRALLTA